jgi:hypothetical protein
VKTRCIVLKGWAENVMTKIRQFSLEPKIFSLASVT